MTASEPRPGSDPVRLGRQALPGRYELVIEPDLDAASFKGSVAVDLRVLEEVDHLICNAVDLVISDVSLKGPDGVALTAAVVMQPELERVQFQLPRTVPAGNYRLNAQFEGKLTDSLVGFYRSTFTDAEGQLQVLAATQFEATDARRAFPCWDEPDMKAVFAISLVVPAGLGALSNGAELDSVDLSAGRRRVRFAETIPMSTYLVAFFVGPLEATEPLDVLGVPLRVAYVPGKGHLGEFAMSVGAHALRYFSDYFGIAYPSDKLDLVAIPDFAFGAMENLGAVFFRESALLVDQKDASRLELERVADVISHEIAHMWFGDLVTMSWWNALWLNEAFATLMEVHAVDSFRPEWERWASFGLDRAHALSVDALSATRPIEVAVRAPSDAAAMFDTLTYEKGAAVLRMLELYLGADRFAKGIRLYLERHGLGNAETTDLWSALADACDEPVAEIMSDWIFQAGHPLVSVRREGNSVVLAQRTFRFLTPPEALNTTWRIPVRMRLRVGGREEEHHLLLGAGGARLSLAAEPEWVMANAGGAGVYRCKYDAPLASALAENLDALDGTELLVVLSDSWGAVLSGSEPLAGFLDIAGRLGDTPDPNPWIVVSEALSLVHHAAGDRAGPFGATVRSLIRPVLAAIGREPGEHDTPLTGTLRAALVSTLGSMGKDPELIEWARQSLRSDWSGEAPLPGDLARAVLSVVAVSGGEEEYEEFLRRYRQAGNPQEELRYLYTLPYFSQPDLLARTLELACGEVRSQNAGFVMRLCLAGIGTGVATWEFLEANWDRFTDRLPESMVPRMLEGLAARCEAGLAEQAESFLATHVRDSGTRQVSQTMERFKVNVAFAAREGAGLDSVLGDFLLGRPES